MGHQTSAHCTLAMCPASASSIQFASYSLGPIRKFRSLILSSSRNRVAVNPSLLWVAIAEVTFRKMDAGTTCTSSRIMSPHSRCWMKFIILAESCERLPLCVTMLYVLMMMPVSPGKCPCCRR